MTRTSDPAPRRRTGRGIVLWLHRWTGLALGLYMVIMGLTGTVLVYEGPIDRWTSPRTAVATVGPTLATLDVAARSAQAAAPDKSISRVHWHGGPQDTYEFCLGPWGRDAVLAYVDPYSGQLLGQRSVRGSFVGFCLYLHYTLLLHQPGWYANSAAGWAMTIVLITGLLLWWPGTLRMLWRRLTIAFGGTATRLNYDVHNVLGAYTFPLLLIVTLTGASFAVLPPVIAAAYQLTGGAPPAKPKADAGGGQLSSFEDLVKSAQTHAGADVYWYRVVLPTDKKPLFEARFTDETRAGRGQRIEVTLDGRSGNLLRRYDTRDGSRTERFFAWIHPLHVGSWGGSVVEVVYALLGLVPLGFAVTGTYLWWTGRRARARAEAHRASRVKGA